jgi:hypothetical protein
MHQGRCKPYERSIKPGLRTEYTSYCRDMKLIAAHHDGGILVDRKADSCWFIDAGSISPARLRGRNRGEIPINDYFDVAPAKSDNGVDVPALGGRVMRLFLEFGCHCRSGN